MTPSAAPQSSAPASGAPARRGALALALQEALTATVRLRSGRQSAPDAETFRAHLKQLLAAADQEGKRLGYTPEDVNLALFAVVAFLDESVLNSGLPMFAEWPRRPLQEELFGGHMAGELFFRYLDQLLQRPDSEDLADVLEVYQLCLLLGFRGRHSAGEPAELHRLTTQIAARLGRMRGAPARLAPQWAPHASESVPVSRDPWLRPLTIAAVATAVLALGLFAGYRVALSGGPARVQAVGGPAA